MSLIARIQEELKDAMRERDAERRDALRLILSSLQSAEKELQRPLNDQEELQVLQRERKRRAEAEEAFRAGGREEQADAEAYELEVLEEFMPEPLTEEQLEEIIDDAIAENGATSLRDLGRVMADVMPQVAGRADGSAVSQMRERKARRSRCRQLEQHVHDQVDVLFVRAPVDDRRAESSLPVVARGPEEDAARPRARPGRAPS